MVSSPKSQLWHGCLHSNAYWRRGLGLEWRVGSSKNARPNSQPNSCAYLFIEWIRFDFIDSQIHRRGHLKLTSWDFASMLGFTNMTRTWGTWDPIWDGPKTLMDKAQKLGGCSLVRTCQHEWDLGLGTPCELVPNNSQDNEEHASKAWGMTVVMSLVLFYFFLSNKLKGLSNRPHIG